MLVLELAAPQAVIRLSADDAGWCRVRLDAPPLQEELGADTLGHVLARLAKALEEQLPTGPTRERDGHDLLWILSLAERHCSLYARDAESRRELWFQRADGTLFYTLPISAETRRQWRLLLSTVERDAPTTSPSP
jgi:hypothetical protein